MLTFDSFIGFFSHYPFAKLGGNGPFFSIVGEEPPDETRCSDMVQTQWHALHRHKRGQAEQKHLHEPELRADDYRFGFTQVISRHIR